MKLPTPSSSQELSRTLSRIEGRGYKAYNELRGAWALPSFTLQVDHVQGDPFAAPSRLRVVLPPATTGLPTELCRPGPRAVGVSCLLARRFDRMAGTLPDRKGSGRSGQISMEAPGQEVIRNTAVQVGPEGQVEARLRLGLPARGRRILGRQAEELLLKTLPELVQASLVAPAFEKGELELHALTNEDADALRSELASRDLVGFVADGARLPRLSGVDDRPMEGEGVVPFESPPGLRLTLPTPNAGPVSGMGIPRGVTLIVGGGYHGKSTLLRALERGVYNHRPGDGREQVVTDPDAVKIRAEDGRPVHSVNISPFIGTLPTGDDTRRFSTANASGSTSQAAAIMEALESGGRTLLMDEDTSATNFMIRDRRMQVLVPGDREPITPFIDRVRELHEALGISSILVLGGSGDYLDVADTVIAMTAFQPSDVTRDARDVARNHPSGRVAERPLPLRAAMESGTPRRPIAGALDPSRGRRGVSLKVRGEDGFRFGTDHVDLTGVEQLVSWPQTRAVAEALVLVRNRFMGEGRSVSQLLDEVLNALDEEGLDLLGHGHDGDLTLFRRHELAAALNRLPTLEVD
jgi:predicted ABC-class ATPase